jgi:predicted HTH domain antitoxin
MMNVQIDIISPEQLLKLACLLSPGDLCWLVTQLNRVLDEAPWPDHVTLDEAIAFFLAGRCSLGRAAELADVTRWDIIDLLQARSLTYYVDGEITLAQQNELFEQLEIQGYL